MNSWWIHAVPIQDPCCLSCTVQEAPSLVWCCHCCCDPRSLVKLDGWCHFCQEDLFQDLGKKWGEYPMKTNLILEISRWTTVIYYLPDFPLALERFLVWHHMSFFLAEKKLRRPPFHHHLGGFGGWFSRIFRNEFRQNLQENLRSEDGNHHLWLPAYPNPWICDLFIYIIYIYIYHFRSIDLGFSFDCCFKRWCFLGKRSGRTWPPFGLGIPSRNFTLGQMGVAGHFCGKKHSFKHKILNPCISCNAIRVVISSQIMHPQLLSWILII